MGRYPGSFKKQRLQDTKYLDSGYSGARSERGFERETSRE